MASPAPTNSNSATDASVSGCLVADDEYQIVEYPEPPYTGPNPPNHVSESGLYPYDYASLRPGAIAWLAEQSCRSGNWIVYPKWSSSGPGITSATIESAVLFCGMATADGFDAAPSRAGTLDTREIAEHVCPEVMD
jgi:hypothetical protein